MPSDAGDLLDMLLVVMCSRGSWIQDGFDVCEARRSGAMPRRGSAFVLHPPRSEIETNLTSSERRALRRAFTIHTVSVIGLTPDDS